MRPLSGPQARPFLDDLNAQTDRLCPFFTTAIMTGPRSAESRGLRWSDLDLSAGTLCVSHTLQRIDGQWQFVEPKSKRSARTLSLPAAVVAALTVQKDRQAFERRMAGSRWQDLNLVFPTPKGTPMEPSNLNGRFHKLLDAAGLPCQGLHSLRHCCASFLLAQGVSPRVVMDQLGHAQVTVTVDTYSHVMLAMLTDAARALDAALASGE